MELYFGEELPELRRLAEQTTDVRRADARGAAKGARATGHHGPTLGLKRPFGLFHDTVWVDLFDTALGRLKLLAIPSSKKIIALDPVSRSSTSGCGSR